MLLHPTSQGSCAPGSVHTLSCRSVFAPASSNWETLLVLLKAIVSADLSHCVITDMCSEILMTSCKGSPSACVDITKFIHTVLVL